MDGAFLRALSSVALIATTVLLTILPADAQTKEQINWCVNKDNVFSPDLTINGCTAAIQSGKWSGKGLAWAFANRGNAYQASSDYDRTLADFNQAIRLDPNNVEAFYGRGNAYVNKGQYDHAIQDYDQAIKLDPRYAPAFSNRGNVYQDKGEYDRAIVDYNEAIRLSPNLAIAYNNRGNAYKAKKDYDRAISDYNEAIRLDPKYAIAYNSRSLAFSAKGDSARAVTDHNEAIRLDPKFAGADNSRRPAVFGAEQTQNIYRDIQKSRGGIDMAIVGLLILYGLCWGLAALIDPRLIAGRFLNNKTAAHPLVIRALGSFALWVLLFLPIAILVLFGWAMSWPKELKTKRNFGKVGGVWLGLLFICLISRTFFFQPFNINGGGEKATILGGDYLIVTKYSYGYSHFSLPLSPPLFSGRILASPPERGDYVDFRLPNDPSVDYIKRVIGLPGDRIQMIDGALHINGEPIQRERAPDFIEMEEGARAAPIKRWKETLPNGVSYYTLDLVDNGIADNTQVYRVPPGHYFMMGDNRDNSNDSRFSQVGMVPFENIAGRAQLIFFSVYEGERAWQFWRWPVSVRWNRLFMVVR